MVGIARFGAYVPRRRLQKSTVYNANAWFAPGLKSLARGERAIANWDEDVVTMAVEAARDCLGDSARDSVRALLFASTSFPFADRQNSGIVKEALALPDDVATLDAGASQKAGTSLLIQALHGATAGVSSLIVAGETRRARPASEEELTNGDAAAALLVAPGDGIARFIGSHSLSVDFVGHFRAARSEFDNGWEARWVREEGYIKLAGRAIEEACHKLGAHGATIDHFVLGIPGRGIGAALAKAAGIRSEAVQDDLFEVLGYVGAAHALVLLARVLESAKPGERILVVGFGQGADVLLFEATDAIATVSKPRGVSGWLAGGVPEHNYLKYLALAGHLKFELGKRAEFDQKSVLSALYRNRRTVLALMGGRCTKTGTIQFPRSEISVDRNDPAIDTQVDYPLADRTARIMTFTADSLTYTPDPPNFYGLVEFEGGGRMLAEFTDADPALIEVGAEMRMMFRVKSEDDRSGFKKYFWKAVPTAKEA